METPTKSLMREQSESRWSDSCICNDCRDVKRAISMKDNAQGFAIRKHRRDLQQLARILASLYKVALLATALGFYSRWAHGDPGVGSIFLSERKLVTANAAYFVSTFGLLGSAALIVTALKVLRGRAGVRVRKLGQIQPRGFNW